VLRAGQLGRLKVTVGELGRDSEANRPARPQTRVDRLGLKVSKLDAATREVLGLKGGVVVEEVGAGPAALAGVQAGDILLRLGPVALDGVDLLVKATEALPPGQTLPLLVKRQETSTFVTLALPAKP
jgi:serine protease Do